MNVIIDYLHGDPRNNHAHIAASVTLAVFNGILRLFRLFRIRVQAGIGPAAISENLSGRWRKPTWAGAHHEFMGYCLSWESRFLNVPFPVRLPLQGRLIDINLRITRSACHFHGSEFPTL